MKTLPNGNKYMKTLMKPMHLKSGEIHQKYYPIEWPDGHIMMQGISGNLMKPAPGYDPTLVHIPRVT